MARNSEVNFRLKPADSEGKAVIYLQFLYNRQRLFFSFGQRIDIANWNNRKQRVKSNKQTTSDGQHSLNDLLDNLEELCYKVYKDELKNGIPSPSTIKEHLKGFLQQNDKHPDEPTLYRLIERFKSGEIKSKGRDKSKGSLQNYNSVLIHLKDFEKAKGYKVTFETVNLDFFYKYTSFLKCLPLAHNTISKDISLLKLFMGEAVDLGYTTNLQFKHKKFSIAEEETDAVYLTEKEVIALYRFDLHNNKLNQAKDLFVFGCFVGLRFSDYSNVKPENKVFIDGDCFLKMKTQKTGEEVVIPCNPFVLEIFEKYKHNANGLPKSISNQKFNEYVKEVCKLAGLTETGRLASDPSKPLSECISSHTARRSFATNYYLEGFPTIDLMKITGHRTEKAFMKYIRVSKLDTAKRLNEHIKKNWSSKLLRVA